MRERPAAARTGHPRRLRLALGVELGALLLQPLGVAAREILILVRTRLARLPHVCLLRGVRDERARYTGSQGCIRRSGGPSRGLLDSPARPSYTDVYRRNRPFVPLTAGASMPSHRHLSLPLALVFAAAASLGVSRTADAQFGSIKDRIKQKAAEQGRGESRQEDRRGDGRQAGGGHREARRTELEHRHVERVRSRRPRAGSGRTTTSSRARARSTSRTSPKTRSATSRSVSPSRPARWKSWSSTADSARSRRRAIASCSSRSPKRFRRSSRSSWTSSTATRAASPRTPSRSPGAAR